MSDLTQPITNPELAQAVADMAAQGSRASREAVLDIVISKARFLAPVTISPAPEQQESAPLGEGTAIQFQLLPNQEGQPGGGLCGGPLWLLPVLRPGHDEPPGPKKAGAVRL